MHISLFLDAPPWNNGRILKQEASQVQKVNRRAHVSLEASLSILLTQQFDESENAGEFI